MSSHRSGAESPQLTESENAYSEPIFHHRPLPGKRFSHGGSNHHHHRKLSLPHSMSSSHYYMPVPPYSPRSPARSLVSSSSCSSSRPISSTGFYKTKKTTTGFFKRRCTVEDEGSFMKLDSGEIQVASGEWIKEHMSHSGVIQVKKKNSRHYVPTTPVDLIKSNKNIKRSWTISNPSGTGGPQIQARSQSDPRNPFSDDPRLPPPKIAPPLFLNIPPPPTTSPPPIPTNPRYVPAFQPPGVMPRRNIPLRSQSMSTADHSTRFYPPRRPPMERVELADTDTDLMDPRKYRTLEGVIGRGRGGQTIITHPENGGYNTNSLERGMRRRLPDIPPSRSLPRPAKRGQSDSRSRDRNGDQKRSQSFGNELEDSRRGNNLYISEASNVKDNSKSKEGRVVREPTPDYDGSSLIGDPILSELKKENKHHGSKSLSDTERSHGGGSGGTQSSAAPSSQFPAHSGAKIQETTATATSQKSHPKDPGVLSAIGTKVNVPSQSEQVGEIITTTTKKITSKTKSVTTTTAKFAHCQSDPTLPEEVSAEEDHHHLLHRNVGSTSTDLSHKLVPDGNDFKLVFISSDSSKDSELNSSLEGGISSDQEKQKRSLGDNKHSGGEFIDDEMEWSLGYRPPIKAKPDFIASSSPKLKKFTKRSAREDPSPPALPPKSKIYHNPHGLGSAFLDDYHFISSSSGGGSVVMSDGEKLPMALSSSPSVVHSIRTSATRDRSSPIRQSPRIPKVHNIPILREDPLPTIHQIKRSRSAHSIIEATESETSQDFEVQGILRKHPKLVVPNVSQKVNTGANLTKPKRTTKTIVGAGGVAASNGVGDLHNTSAEVEHYMSAKGFASITNNDDHHKMLEMAKSVNANGQHHHHHHHLYPTGNVSTAGGSIRSFEDRSLGEMSIHDQLVLLSELEGEVEEDPKIEHFRSYLLAEIKAYNESHKGSEGLLSTRSLSESDLSELCGASVQAPSPDELLRSFSPSSEQTVLKSSSNTRDETSSTSTGDTTYEKEKSTRRAARMTQGSLPDDVPRAEGSPQMLPPKNRRINSAIDGGTTGEGGSGGCGGLRVPSTGHLGPQALTQMKGNAGIRAPSGSVSSSRASGGSSSASTSSTSSGCTVNNKFQLPETFVDIDQWQTQNNHGNGEHCSDKTNREFKSEYRLSLNPTSENQGGVYRSASSITSRPKGKAPVVKPVRRSKSHKATSVTNILHGGPVTFVSVNNINHLVELTTPENPCSEELFQGSHTLPRASGSNRTAKTKAKSSCSDDSDVIITNTTHMDSGGKGVRIQIGSGGSSQGGTKAGIAPSVLSSSSSSHQSHPHGRFPKQNSSDKTKRASKAVSATLVGSSGIFEEKPDNVDKNRIEQECQTSIDFRYSEYDTLASNGVSSNPLTSSARVSCPSKVIASTSSKNKKGRRKYTLEELEVEGFEPSSCSESEKLHISDADLDEDDIDLSSLIEGAVDDDDEEEEDDVDEEAYDVVNSIANNEAMNDPRLHMKPVQVSTKMQGNSDSNPLGAHHQARIQRVDDVVSSEDEDLLSMAVHQGSLSSHNFVALQPHSDTEADFLESSKVNNSQKRGSSSSSTSVVNTSAKSRNGGRPLPPPQPARRRMLPKEPTMNTVTTIKNTEKHAISSREEVEKSQLLKLLPTSDNSNRVLSSGNLSIAAEASDFDSISTTSASYVVNHSDVDSILNEEFSNNTVEGNDNETKSTDERQLLPDRFPPHMSIDAQATPSPLSSKKQQGQQISSPPALPKALPSSTTSTINDGQEHCATNTVAKAKSALGLPVSRSKKKEGDELPQGTKLAPSSPIQAGRTRPAKEVGPENQVEENEQKEQELEEVRSASNSTAVVIEEIRSEQGPPVKSSRKEKTVEIEPEAQTSDNIPTEEQVNADNNDLDDLVEATKPGEHNSPQQELKQRKGSVSDLIARFETSHSRKISSSSSTSNVDSLRSTRSVTPERNSRSITPDQRPSSANGQFTRSKSATPSLSGLAEESESKSEEVPSERGPIGSPIPETDEINIEHELEPEPEKEKPKPDTDEALETLPLGAEALTLEQEPTEEVSGEPGEPLDLEGLDEEMAKTLRNRNGGYTSYVFISSDPTQDDASSVVSVGSNKSVGDNRVRVNIKETGANCVVLQDGRASNISIVSTESSELGSPTSPINGNDEDELFMQRPQQVPELPAKIRSRNGGVIDLAQHFSPPPSLEYRARARGGEVPEPFEDEFLNRNEDTPSPPGDDAQNDRNGLANYFTNALEASGHPSSRRGRPPVIRAADRAARTRQHQMAPDQFDDDDDHDGMEGPVDGEGHDYMYDEDHEFQISELHDSSHPYDEEDVLYSDEYDPNYEVRYESGEEDEYGETVREYPMCQPVYDDSGDEYSEGEPLSSGDEYFDREEELRGYNRQIDFTLHTILEESCEDSEYESRSLEQHQQQKRQSDPSALERYFFYDVGGGNEDDTFSETSLNTTSERTHEEEDLSIAAEESASNRYDKYFAPPLGSGQNNPVESLEMISDVQTDDGGSVGSESDGQRSPNGFNKKKKVIRSKGFRTERLSDRGESDNGNSNVEDDPLHRPLEASYSNSSDDSHAQISGETQFDTMKRKKKQPRRTSVEDRKSDGERSADSRRPSGASVEQLGVINPLFKAPINVEDSLKKDGISPKGTPPITPLPSQIIEVQPASTSSGSSLEPVLQQSASPSGSEKEFDLMKQSKKSKAAQLLQRESSHASPTGSPPVNGPVRKHKSRDSGFVGSTDDLLRNETNQVGVTSSDSNHSLSDHENERKNSQPRLEKLSEVSENTEDDAENHQQHLVDIAFGKGDIKAEQIVNFQLPRRESPEAMRGPLNHSQLVRKDSFQNWSSDEDTNIMMNRMRSFFKGILAGHHGVTPESKEKPPQILAFEEQLTKLMRTVPGINEDQVKEIVEYLSSEDTWSDSYDSSDYTSSDLEGAYGYIDADIPDLNISPEIQQQISASCQEIIQKFDTGSSGAPQHANLSVDQDEFQKEAALMYQQLMAKMQQNQMEKELHRQASKSTRNSPPIAAKVMQHISTRLVALMHEAGGVNSDGGNSSPASITETTSGTFSDRRQVGPPTRRYKRVVPEDKKGDDAQGPNINAHLSKSSSKSVEALTANSSKKTANDYDVWQGVARDSNQTQGQPRRGSLGMVKSQMESLQSQSSSSINEDERCSWKGSFESTLAADISTKQRRVGSNSELNSSSIEQIDKSRSGSKSARGTRNSSRPTPSIVHTDSEDESVRTSSQNDPSASSTLPREHSLHSSSSSSVRSSVSSRHSTNSLPRLGTSAIKKSRAPQAPTSTATGPSQIMTTTVTLAAALSAGPNGGGSGPRSARYRPPGYKPAPTRKISPSMGHVLPQRKTSIEGVFVQRFNDDVASEFSSKSGSPSPVIMRDFRESSVNSKSSLETNEEEPRDERYPSPFNKAGSLSSLGSRSESMLSVYSQEGGRYGSVVVRGEVELGMLYSFSSGCLEMAIKQCRDLAAVDTKRNRSDPYVKVYLLPDKTKSGKRKTKVKKHTLNPVFDEILKFQMPLSEVEKRTIWLTVWHSDMFGRNDFLGEVMLPMAGQVYDDPSPKWYSLQDRTEPPGGDDDPMGAYRGEIIIALKFVPSTSDLKSKSSRQVRKTRGMLMVLIKEAKNLVPLKGSANTDPFCKCYLLPERNKTGKQKTNVCRRTSNPRWEHTVTWDQVTMAELADRSLEVSVWDHDRLGQNDMLGGVRFNLGSGKHQSKPSAWMDSTGKEVTLWQQMLDRPNFWVEGAVHLRPVEKMNSTPSPI